MRRRAAPVVCLVLVATIAVCRDGAPSGSRATASGADPARSERGDPTVAVVDPTPDFATVAGVGLQGSGPGPVSDNDCVDRWNGAANGTVRTVAAKTRVTGASVGLSWDGEPRCVVYLAAAGAPGSDGVVSIFAEIELGLFNAVGGATSPSTRPDHAIDREGRIH